ncbi:MAG: hypothetical protein KAJ92_04775 [Gammaproteobacteria bacterium]|nr:hypothetical protein [Gammaproteobacteria bacterium]
MSMINSRGLGKGLILLVVNCVLPGQSVNANEWQEDYVPKSGFSDFSPPSVSSRYKDTEDRRWASGSTFNAENRVRYTPKSSRNPWKPIKSSFSKKTFGSKRPWGNVPDRKPPASNMKLHDQRFKRWISQRDSSYRNFSALTNPLSNYGYPGSMYNDPLITPSIYPGSVFNGAGYLGQRYPFTGLPTGPMFW